ncbi:hypothetical protein L1887_14636 [Cichorium endivia]|nr:hypothetical protein L1887_14636 [Cichorium endivia]
MDSKFSDDMKMEILSRTSLKALDTMRCTSQEFQYLTYESYFLNLYKQRNDIVSGFLLVNLRSGCEYINEFAPSTYSHSLDLVSSDKPYTKYRLEIFDSRAWAWRLLDPVILPSFVFLSNQQPIVTRGSIYMLLSNNEVLKFDAYSEKWTMISSPIQTLDCPFGTTRKLVKYKGKLSFTCETQSRLSWEIWVLTSDESWEKLHVFDTREDVGRSSLEAIYDLDTRVMNDYSTLHSYRILTFRSDFEPAHFEG